MLFFYKPTVTELGYAKVDGATVPSVDSTAKMHDNYLSAYRKDTDSMFEQALLAVSTI